MKAPGEVEVRRKIGGVTSVASKTKVAPKKEKIAKEVIGV